MNATTTIAVARAPRWYQTLLLCLSFAFCASGVNAAPLLSVGGNSNQGYIIHPDQAAAVSFTLTQGFNGVAITANLTKISQATDGGVYLVRNLGPSATLADVVATANFSAINFVGSGTLLFSGLTLGVGDYAVVVADSQSTAGNVIWDGSNSATVTQAAGVIDGIDFFSANTSGFLFNSVFLPVLPSVSSAFFAVTVADPIVINDVPEPESLLLVVFGLASLVVVRARNRRG